MTCLHTLSRSWHDSTWIFEQLAFSSAGDAILLMHDAVLAVQSPITLASFLAKCESREVTVYALQDDMKLRGISNKHKNLITTDYIGFVDLAVQHERQIAW